MGEGERNAAADVARTATMLGRVCLVVVVIGVLVALAGGGGVPVVLAVVGFVVMQYLRARWT